MDFIAEINARIGVIDEQLNATQKAFSRVQELEKQLEQARKDLQATSGWQVGSHRRAEKKGLLAVKAQIEQGCKALPVRPYHGDPITGAVIKRTPTRVTVLTYKGEMVFSLKSTTWGTAGQSYGQEGRGYSINPADLE